MQFCEENIFLLSKAVCGAKDGVKGAQRQGLAWCSAAQAIFIQEFSGGGRG